MSSQPAPEKIFTDCPRFIECHASSLLELTGKKFLIVWFAGTKEGHDDVGIWAAEGNSGSWSEPKIVAKVADLPHWNPVLFQSISGTVHIFFKVGPKPTQWITWQMRSEDEGREWTSPQELVPGDSRPRGPVKNKIIRLSDGNCLAPSSVENVNGFWDAFVDRSDDDGETWMAGDLLPLDHETFAGKGVIQPTLWESKPGHVHMLLRSTSGSICRSDSRDGGRTWSKVFTTDLPSNNSGIDIVRLADGRLVLAYNPVSGDWAPRSPLSLAISEDNGFSWPYHLELESGVGEFSYPAVIETRKGVAATYTWKRRSIAFWQGSVDSDGGTFHD